MASIDLHLSLKILTFLSNHINHIKNNTTTYHKVFSFGRLPKPLKEITIISLVPLGGTYQDWISKAIFAEVLIGGTMNKVMIGYDST